MFFSKHRLQVVNDLVRLRGYALRIRLMDRGAAKRHLPSQVDPAIGFNSVAERGNWVRCAGDGVVL